MRSNVQLPFNTQASDNFYHVVLRVNRLETLADTPRDRRALNAITIDTLRRFDMRLHAYCLMPNHLRALIEVDDRVIIEALRRVARGYSRYRRLNAAGQLFERPYTAHRVATDKQFLELLRFIHLTPVIANRVTAPRDYPWSSHRAYLGFKSNALITTSHGLSLFAETPSRARAEYLRFMAEGSTIDVRDEGSIDANAAPDGAATGNFTRRFATVRTINAAHDLTRKAVDSDESACSSLPVPQDSPQATSQTGESHQHADADQDFSRQRIFLRQKSRRRRRAPKQFLSIH